MSKQQVGRKELIGWKNDEFENFQVIVSAYRLVCKSIGHQTQGAIVTYNSTLEAGARRVLVPSIGVLDLYESL